MNSIEKAMAIDFEMINLLLKNENLPIVESNDPKEYFFKALDENKKIIGAIGLEIYGKYGLLRSMVVIPKCRNNGIAGALVASIEKLSQQLKLKELWLLTSTAENYFERKGYIRIPRNEVQDEIKQSKEFKSICPVSAIIMKKNL